MYFKIADTQGLIDVFLFERETASSCGMTYWVAAKAVYHYFLHDIQIYGGVPAFTSNIDTVPYLNYPIHYGASVTHDRLQLTRGGVKDSEVDTNCITDARIKNNYTS